MCHKEQSLGTQNHYQAAFPNIPHGAIIWENLGTVPPSLLLCKAELFFNLFCIKIFGCSFYLSNRNGCSGGMELRGQGWLMLSKMSWKTSMKCCFSSHSRRLWLCGGAIISQPHINILQPQVASAICIHFPLNSLPGYRNHKSGTGHR